MKKKKDKKISFWIRWWDGRKEFRLTKHFKWWFWENHPKENKERTCIKEIKDGKNYEHF